MRLARILALCIIFVIGITPLLTTLSAYEIPASKINTPDLLETYTIEDIPYVAQNGRYLCYYACLTMIFNFMGLNTSLEEMSFYGGVGYTHTYNRKERLPNEGIYSNLDVIFEIFGITQQNWWPLNNNLLKNELWEQYYTILKENISKDTPVITAVNPFSLPSVRDQFHINDFLWGTLFPPGYHLIVVLGYNDTNQSICYNDPNAGFFGASCYGDHAWTSLNTFREAVEKNKHSQYIIYTYKQSNQPYSKKEAFEEALRKNIENLKGNSIYSSKGINASKMMQKDFSLGKNKSQETSRLYKEYGDRGVNNTLITVLHKLLSVLYPHKANIFDILMVGAEDPFKAIAIGKEHTAAYLQRCPVHPNVCKNQSILLRQEAEKWNEVSKKYTVFLRRGVFLSDMRAILLMNKMEKLMEDIIDIEEALITP
jgi:hypothetical protein